MPDYSVQVGKSHRVPDLEMALALKFAAMDSPNRRLNKKLLDKVIAKVRGTGDAASARALQELADKYEYDALTRLLEDTCVR